MKTNTDVEIDYEPKSLTEKNDEAELKNIDDIYSTSLKINRKSVCKTITVDELYEEILFVILSNANETQLDPASETLVRYMQKVFEISTEKHLEFLKNAQTKNAPQKTLTVEVDRAENLFAMDSNGLSDPFVTVYIESNAINRYNTAVVPSTLNPSWREQFLIPIQGNPATEMLVIEVWDFDAAESVGEKMNKLADVKGIRGFKKLLKEIALTASTGKHDNELIGRIHIPLKTIPPTGINSWYKLKKNSNNRTKGSILLHLHFSTEKKKVIAISEHRNLLKIFLLHQIKFNKMAPYVWHGNFDTEADTIIRRHCVQSNLSEIDCSLCQWDVYTQVHESHCLSLKFLSSLLKNLLVEVKGMTYNYEYQFWDGYKRILPSCFVIVRSVRNDKFEEIYGIDNLSAALEIIKAAQPPEDVDLFPAHIYGWLGKEDKSIKLHADIVLKETIKLSASHFLNKVFGSSKAPPHDDVQDLITVMRYIVHDLQKAVEFHDKLFYVKCNIKYASFLYSFYQENAADIFYPKIIHLCSNLNQLNVLDEEIVTISKEKDFKSGTLLFDLYLCFKRFTNLGSALFLVADNLVNNEFYDCFYPAVANWLNISVIKTLTRIEKAIELDELLPYNHLMKYSSSALDTLSLFYQIKYFWEQLDWPNIEESYLFIERIVNDVCRCSAFYANRLCQRLYEMKGKECINLNSQDLKDYCYAINDINYIKESLPLFVKELKISDILKRLADLRSTMEAERCFATINNIIRNNIDTVENKMFELIEVMAQMIVPIIQKIFEEGSQILYESSDSNNQLLKYLQKCISIFQAELQEDSLNKLTSVICNEISILMCEVIQSELNKCRQPSCFEKMLGTLNIILQMLNIEANANLKDICAILKLHAMETENIIHQYYKDQLQSQSESITDNYGQLSIKANISNDSLHVHILNAFQLLTKESENSCNSYVKVNFTPADKFVGIQSLRTSVQHKTRCPLYDEQFFTKLSPDQCQNKSNILVFCVKNKDLFGLSNHYIAECYLSFGDIEKANNRQIRMNLKKTKYSDTDLIRILTSRTGDKRAKEFLKKLRKKSSDHNKT